jgi:hypothetical protein
MTDAELDNKTRIPSHAVRIAMQGAMDAEMAAARVPDGGAAGGGSGGEK